MCFRKCMLTVCLLLCLYTQGLGWQHEKWKTILAAAVLPWCPGGLEISHLIEAVIEQDDLRPLAPGTLSDQHVARVWVTVNEAVDEDHLAVHLPQVF